MLIFKREDIFNSRYRLESQLGRTAVGHQTWLATDLQSGEFITIKLLAFSPQIQWEELKLFEREANILKSLNHPRIPRYRDYFDIDKDLGGGIAWFALVQDYIPGSSLQDLIEQSKRFTEGEIRTIATEVLEILLYLHALNPTVLHRDIKPGNLILGEDKHIYLIDFGAVQAQAAVTGVTFTIVGTSGYAPLEQFWGRAVPASDIYALGATLIHLLTGISPADLPQKDSRIQFSDRVNISLDFIVWLETATDILLENRFQSAKEALEMLQAKHQKLAKSAQVYARNKLTKPSYSKVDVTRSTERIGIYFPSILELKFGRVGKFVGLFFFMIIVPLMSLAFPPTLVIFLIWAICFYQSADVIFERDRFAIKRKLLGFNYRTLNGSNHDIVGVFLHSGQNGYTIKIYTDSKTYLIGDYLKERECAWLAQEIQDWLKSQE